MALRMRECPSSSKGHTTSKSYQSAGSQERRGKHTHTHTQHRDSLIHFTSLVQCCSAAATPFTRISLFQVWLDRMMENRQPAAAKNPGLLPAERARLRRSKCINAQRYWLSTLASSLSPHPLLLFHSPYLSYISFSPSLTTSLALSLSQLSRLRCMQN